MSLMERVRKNGTLSQQEKLVLGILSDESMTAKALLECLMSEPYGLTQNEVLKALTMLKKHGLLEIQNFVVNANGFDIDTRLTFAYDWVLKL